jgi:hypothetical protein
MKTSHVVGIVAGVGALGVLFYLGTKGSSPAKQYYPGAQGVPVNRVGGAPGNSNPLTPSNYTDKTAQLITAGAGAAVQLLPTLADLFGSDGEPSGNEVTGSVEGLPGNFDSQGI